MHGASYPCLLLVLRVPVLQLCLEPWQALSEVLDGKILERNKL